MQIAQVLAGYTLGGADLLRRAMGKKIQSEMDAQRQQFVDGAVARGVERERAELIFDQMAKFAGYGFNKPHAAAYALITYQTAYLKANYPVEFLAASMTLDLGNTDKLHHFRQELDRLGIRAVAARHQPLAADLFGRDRSEERQTRDPLCAGRGQGRRRAGDDRAGRASATATGRSRTSPISRSGSTPRASTAASSKASPAPARSIRSTPTGRKPWPRPKYCCATPAAPPRIAKPGRKACSVRSTRPSRRGPPCRLSRTGRRSKNCSRNSRRSAFTCRATRSTPTARAWNAPGFCAALIYPRHWLRMPRPVSGSPALSSAAKSVPQRAATALHLSRCRTRAGFTK